MEIKRLVLSDSSAVHGIMEKSFSTTWSVASIENLISGSNAACFGAFEDDVLTGYVFLEWILDEGSLTDIAVLPEYRGRGISLLLMDALMEEAKKQELSFVTLEVRVSNTPAISLYKKYSFAEVGRRSGYYSAPKEDALLMTCNL